MASTFIRIFPWKTDLGLIRLKSNFRATGQTKSDTVGRSRRKYDYVINLIGYKIEPFLRTGLGRYDYYNIVNYYRLSDDRNNRKVKYRVEGNGGGHGKDYILMLSFLDVRTAR